MNNNNFNITQNNSCACKFNGTPKMYSTQGAKYNYNLQPTHHNNKYKTKQGVNKQYPTNVLFDNHSMIVPYNNRDFWYLLITIIRLTLFRLGIKYKLPTTHLYFSAYVNYISRNINLHGPPS